MRGFKSLLLRHKSTSILIQNTRAFPIQSFISLSHERFLSRICSFEKVSLHNANSALFLVLGCHAKAFRLAAYRIKMVAFFRVVANFVGWLHFFAEWLQICEEVYAESVGLTVGGSDLK